MRQTDVPVLEVLFDSDTVVKMTTNKTKMISLYSHRTMKIRAIFIYGSDYPRKVAQTILLDALAKYWFMPIWFLLTTTALHVIRLKTASTRNRFSSSVLDMINIFFGGASVRNQHRFERGFIIIMIFGMFFLQSIWISDFLSKASDLRHSNGVDTFKKVGDLKKPIYVARTLSDQKDVINKILWLVLKVHEAFIE